MVLVHPEKGVGNEEIPYLVAAQVENQRAPVRLGAHEAGVLVKVRPVEGRQSEVVPREMGGHPVHDDADVLTVQRLDQGAEVVGATEAGRRGVVRAHLVTPGTPERVLGYRQELDVGKAHFLHVGRQLFGELEVGEGTGASGTIVSPAPGTDMDLVHRHRPLERISLQLLGCPAGIFPAVVGGLCYD